jgi:regulatory protein
VKRTALHCAVGLLARREHSESELTRKLIQREFPQEEIDEAIARVLEKNYLCDERFASSRCRYQVKRGFGWSYIANELKQKGVCATIIQNLRESCEIDWYLQAELAYNKRFGVADEIASSDNEVLDKKAAQKEQAKKIRFLQYRGFSTDEIFSVIDN